MGIRSILAPLLGTSDDMRMLDRAMGIGALFRSHVEVLHVRPDPEEAFLYMGLDPKNREKSRQQFRDLIDAEGRAAAAEARRHFDDYCRQHGIARAATPGETQDLSAAYREAMGEAAFVVPEHAKLADLTVFSWPLADQRSFWQSVFETTLLRAGGPVLALPDAAEDLSLSRVLIAWDGSASCARAVRSCLAAKADFEHVSVLSVEEENAEAADPSGLVRALEWHGVTAGAERIEAFRQPVGEIVLDTARRHGANVIVMGGYGHQRFREAIFGGTTRRLLRTSEIPLFMMH